MATVGGLASLHSAVFRSVAGPQRLFKSTRSLAFTLLLTLVSDGLVVDREWFVFTWKFIRGNATSWLKVSTCSRFNQLMNKEEKIKNVSFVKIQCLALHLATVMNGSLGVKGQCRFAILSSTLIRFIGSEFTITRKRTFRRHWPSHSGPSLCHCPATVGSCLRAHAFTSVQLLKHFIAHIFEFSAFGSLRGKRFTGCTSSTLRPCTKQCAQSTPEAPFCTDQASVYMADYLTLLRSSFLSLASSHFPSQANFGIERCTELT